MQIKTSAKPVKADMLVLPLYEAKTLPKELKKHLAKEHQEEAAIHFKKKTFEAKLGQTLTFTTKTQTITLLGLGKKKELNLHKVKRAASGLGAIAKSSKSKTIQILDEEHGLWIATALYLKSYNFERYMPKKKDNHKITSVTVVGNGSKSFSTGAKNLTKQIDSIYYTRDLVNTTSNDMTPGAMVKEARKLASKYSSLSVTVLDRKKIQKLKMGSIMAVGQAGDGPYIVMFEYKYKAKSGKKPVAIVGKGLTFDTGGINLKPTGHIETMKQDKAGACTVLGTFKALAETKFEGHVVGAIGLAENLIGEKAIRPGDIVTTYTGKTMEITNTDAEGRMVLADTIAYLEEKKSPSHIISLSTLTGAAVIALGPDITALLCTNPKLAEALKQASDETDEPIWELPLYEDYCDKIKGEISDLVNWSKAVRAGTIQGGGFLAKFVKKAGLAHLDMGGTGWADEPKDCCPKGATGANLMLVMKTLEKL